jgi:hypothetical protein
VQHFTHGVCLHPGACGHWPKSLLLTQMPLHPLANQVLVRPEDASRCASCR